MKQKFSRILAFTAIILLLALYAITLISSLFDSEIAHSLLIASIYCTVTLPVLIYTAIAVHRYLRKKNEEK